MTDFYLDMTLVSEDAATHAARMQVRIGPQPWPGSDEPYTTQNEPELGTKEVDMVITAPGYDTTPITAKLPWPPAQERVLEFSLEPNQDHRPTDALLAKVELISRGRPIESIYPPVKVLPFTGRTASDIIKEGPGGRGVKPDGRA